MRVVCLVPSWTETLLEAGAHVVGRTRFCIHPRDRVVSIPVVGGTKQVDWAKVTELSPDLLVLDREENPRSVAEQSPVPWIATDVTSVNGVERDLVRLSERLSQPDLLAMARRWREACLTLATECRYPGWLDLPGVMKWVRHPSREVTQFLYLIWKDPWMAAGPGTFVASMLDLLGFGSRMCPLAEKYPQILLEDYDPTRTLLLFASEPYAFCTCQELIEALPFASALVDGTCFSWYGLRALRFLEEHVSSPGQ